LFGPQPVFPAAACCLKLFGLPLVMPTIVAILGIVAIYGAERAGSTRLAKPPGLPATTFLYGNRAAC